MGDFRLTLLSIYCTIFPDWELWFLLTNTRGWEGE